MVAKNHSTEFMVFTVQNSWYSQYRFQDEMAEYDDTWQTEERSNVTEIRNDTFTEEISLSYRKENPSVRYQKVSRIWEKG